MVSCSTLMTMDDWMHCKIDEGCFLGAVVRFLSLKFAMPSELGLRRHLNKVRKLHLIRSMLVTGWIPNQRSCSVS
jgi:hypothetical protein